MALKYKHCSFFCVPSGESVLRHSAAKEGVSSEYRSVRGTLERVSSPGGSASGVLAPLCLSRNL